MGNKRVPDAWEDDWEVQADRADQDAQEPAVPQASKTKAERLAEHHELNRRLWQEAEAPAEMYHVAATSNVPFAQGFKQPMKLLSRKPVTKTRDPVTGMERLTVQDDLDEDEGDKKPQPTAEEIRERRRRELEEKERSYEEKRAMLFGETPPGTPSGSSTPGNATPPPVGEGIRGNYRGRGRGRGGRGRGGQRNDSYNKTDIQERRAANNSGSPYRELFDPDGGTKPGARPQRGAGTSSPSRGPEAAIRNPRGPDDSGRGGFGFATRGNRGG